MSINYVLVALLIFLAALSALGISYLMILAIHHLTELKVKSEQLKIKLEKKNASIH